MEGFGIQTGTAIDVAGPAEAGTLPASGEWPHSLTSFRSGGFRAGLH